MADEDGGETREHDQLPTVDEILANRPRERPTCKKMLINLGVLAAVTAIFLVGLVLGLKRPWVNKSDTQTKEEGFHVGNPALINLGLPNDLGEYITVDDLVTKGIALFGGKEFENPRSYQSKALNVMKKNSVIANFIFTEQKLAQRYALLCLYFRTNRVRTDVSDTRYGYGTTPRWKLIEPWNFAEDECRWYGVACNIFGLVIRIELPNHFLTGYVPDEMKHIAKGPIYSIDFSGNGGLGQGGFPSVFLEFNGLELLELSGCNFDGEVPADMCEKDIDYFAVNCGCSCACCQPCS